MWWVVNITPRPLYPREIAGTHFIGGWVSPQAVWADAKNLAPTGIRSPDRPGHRESLYRLRNPDPILAVIKIYLALICNIIVKNDRSITKGRVACM
jgi:hypothetical protein